MSTPSTLRLHVPQTIDDPQISGGDELSDDGRNAARWLSANLTEPNLIAWVAEFRDVAKEQPADARAIVDALAAFLLGDSGDAPVTGREATIIVIGEHLEQCSDDELRIVGAVCKRLEIGRERYGRLELETDRRDWPRELGEELLDAVIYAAIVRLTGGKS